MKKYLLHLLVFMFTWTGLQAQQQATAISMKSFKRLYQLNDSVYRSEQPTKRGFERLESSGVKTILNLRRVKEDHKKARGTSLNLKHLRLKSKEIDEADLLNALSMIKDAEKPVLIHCWHGSDRTGVVSAAYRIVFEGWSKEDAIAEFRREEFGYHENWYPNLLELLQNLDVPKVRAMLDL